MEGDKYIARVADIVVEFQQYFEEVVQAIDQDEKFSDMTVESYEEKKSHLESHISRFSRLHNELADIQRKVAGLLPMQGDKYIDSVTYNVADFQQYLEEVVKAIDQVQNFKDMAVESYEENKDKIKSLIMKLSRLHNKLAGEYADLIEVLSKNCPSLLQNQHVESSESCSSPQVTETVASKFTAATGYNVLLQPDGGGFYHSNVEGSSHSGSKSSSVNEDLDNCTIELDKVVDVKKVRKNHGSGGAAGLKREIVERTEVCSKTRSIMRLLFDGAKIISNEILMSCLGGSCGNELLI